MAVSKKKEKTVVFTHPPFVLDVAISWIVRQPKKCYIYYAHIHSHVRHTIE